MGAWLNLRAWLWAALMGLVSAYAAPARADTVSFGDAPLISTSDAWTYYQTLTLTSPTSATLDPLIVRTAHALGDDPDRIYTFVHDTIEITPLFGGLKGGRGALIDKSGTAFDQAQLLAELLRAAGYTVQYELGTITLDHSQVLSWLGVDNATAVSDILSDGGIPANISSASGVVTSVTMMHLWVGVTIPGASCSPCMLDAAFKDHVARTGTLSTSSLDTAMGFNASTLMGTASGGAMNGATGSTSTAPHVSGFNGANVRARMQDYSAALLSNVQSNYPNSDLAGVIGGRDIAPYTGSPVRQGALPYQTSVLTTFSNDVPYALRTQLSASIGSDNFSWRLDEVYAREIAVSPAPTSPHAYSTTLNGVAIGTSHSGITVPVSIHFDHPYAANSGAYEDHDSGFTGHLNAGAFQFLVGGGEMTSDFGAYLEARSSGTESYISYCCGDEQEQPVGSQAATKRRIAAAFAGQFGSALSLEARIGGGTIVLHDVLIGSGSRAVFLGGGGGLPASTTAVMQVMANLSATSNDGSSTNAVALRRAASALSATLEASVIQQTLDSVYADSTATRFDWASDNGVTFWWANSSNWSGTGGVQSHIDTDYMGGSPITTEAQSLITAGYSIIIPQSSNLGPGEASVQCSPLPCSTVGPERGGAVIGLSANAVSHRITVTSNGSPGLEGGAGTDDAEVNPSRIYAVPEDFLQRQFSSRAEAYSVDLGNGAVTYAPPPDMVVGEGSYPYSLSFQRSFHSGASVNTTAREDVNYQIHANGEQFADSGWTSNFVAEARIQNDGADAFGVRSPAEATDTIAAIRVLIALSGDQSSDLETLKFQLGAMHAMAWWNDQLSFNAVAIVHGPSVRTFFRLADDTASVSHFSAPPGDSTQISLTGDRYTFHKFGSGFRRYLYDGMCVREVGTDGSTSYYGRWTTPSYSSCQTSAGVGDLPFQPWLRFRHQVFPQGVEVNFDDVTLSNTLGRQISLTNNFGAGSVTGAYTVRDGGPTSTLRTASLSLDLTYANGVLSATGTDANTWVYDASSGTNWRIFAPSSSTIPIANFAFGDGGAVSTLTDGCRAAQCGSTGGNVSTYYISSGRVGAMTDALGHQSRIYYDANSQPVRSIDRSGNETRTAYDTRRRVIRVDHPEGNYDTTSYDSRNNPTDVYRHPKPGSSLATTHTSTAYDSTALANGGYCNMPVSQTDANANVTTYTLVSGHCLISQMTQAAVDDGATTVTTLVNPTTTYTWNALGQRLTRIDPTGVVTTNTYSGSSNYLASVNVAAGTLSTTTSFGRDSYGDINSVTDPGSHVFTGTYDAARRLTEFDGPSGTNVQTQWHYNSDGQIDYSRQSTGASTWATTTYTYLATGRPATMTDPLSHVTTYYYDGLGRSTAIVDPMTRRSETSYDNEGHVTQQRRAVGTSLEINYATRTWTANGMLSTVSDANGNLSSMVYDGFDRLARLYFPSTTMGAGTANTSDYEEYGYDANDNRTSLRVRSGESISYCYDALNRQSRKDMPGGTSGDVYSSYDRAGRRLFARFNSTPPANCNTYPSDGQGIDFGYDAIGRLSTETSYGRALTFGYDNTSNRTRVTFPDSNYFAYDYDAMNRVVAVRENGASSGAGVLNTYSYDRLSRRTSQSRGNGDAVTYSYNDGSQLLSLVSDLAGTSNDASFSFGYNDDGQLTSRTFVTTYEYPIATVSRSYTRNGLNQYTAVSSTSFSYDGRGNLTSDGARTFGYDLENHLTSVSTGTTSLTYDPIGRLHAMTTSGATTEFLYDGDRLVAEYNSSGTMQRRYVHGPGVDEPIVWYEGSNLSDRRHLITDRQGSVIAEDGSSVTRYQYGPFGEPNAWTGSRFRYTGQIVLPEIQLYHYKARVYDPVLGRFLQTDPVWYEVDLNLYSYVGGDPLDFSDSSGRRWPDEDRQVAQQHGGYIPPNSHDDLRMRERVILHPPAFGSDRPPPRQQQALPANAAGAVRLEERMESDPVANVTGPVAGHLAGHAAAAAAVEGGASAPLAPAVDAAVDFATDRAVRGATIVVEDKMGEVGDRAQEVGSTMQRGLSDLQHSGSVTNLPDADLDPH